MVRDKLTGDIYDIFYPQERIKVLYCRKTGNFLHVTRTELFGPLFEQVHVEDARSMGLLNYSKEENKNATI